MDPEPTRTGIRRRYLVFMIVGLLVLAGATTLLVTELVSGGDDEVTTLEPEVAGDGTVTYVIPAGTRARISAGEGIAVIPAKITLKVGQSIVLRNEDSDAHIAGPFFVGPGEESRYTFSAPTVIAGDCTIHPSGSFEIEVVE